PPSPPRYNDYGYFLDWQAEAPASTLMMLTDSLSSAQESANTLFKKHSPPAVQNAWLNFQYNVGNLYKQGRKMYKKHVAPFIKEYLSLDVDPKAAEKQKRADAKAFGKGKKKKKNDFRDDEEEE
ncbi:hypothetical protein TeGR_g11513, partial [Tetraparma gracilis]